MGVSAPSSVMNAKPNGWLRGCRPVGCGTHVQVDTVPFGPTRTQSVPASADVSGSYSSGGAMTRPPVRTPMIWPSAIAELNVLSVEPNVRENGNVRLKTNS